MPAPLKRYSQNWLANPELATALVRHIAPREGDHFLEIGPGDGRLTRSLLEHPVDVTAVDVDPRCCRELEAYAERVDGDGASPRLTVVEKDVLRLDPGELSGGAMFRFVGNLPYAISSPVLRWTVKHHARVVDAHYMLPEDIAVRVLAPPGASERGLISVIVGWFFEGEIVRRLGPEAFRPAPMIRSSFVRLTPVRPPECAAPPAHRRAVVEAAFAHRRKTLRNGLRAAGWGPADIDAAAVAAGVTADARAEALGVDEFARLATALPILPG